MSREILFFIPILMFLPHFLKLDGIWMTVPLADFLAFLLTLLLLNRFRKTVSD
jgi:Na+-driven multidrug efflux pump